MSGDKDKKRSWFGRVLGKQAAPVVEVPTARPRAPLQALRAAVDGWKADYPEGPEADQRDRATKRMKAVADDLTLWNATQLATASDADKAEALDLAEQVKVCRTRIDIAARPAAAKKLPNRPLLASAWCDKNVEKGTLLDALKKTLPAFEKAAATLNKAPSAAAVDDAQNKLAVVKQALDAAVVHYTKADAGQPPSAKSQMATQLVGEAVKQAAVLAALKTRAAEFDPATAGPAAQKKVTDGRQARVDTLDATLATQLDDAQKNHDANVQKFKDELAAMAIKLQSKLDTVLDGDDDDDAKAQAQVEYDAAVVRNGKFLVSFTNTEAATLARKTKDANDYHAARAGLAELSWAACSGVVTKKTALHGALDKSLPAYEQARAAFEANASAATLQAALDALWVVQGGVQKASEKIASDVGKLPKDGADDRRAELGLADQQADILLEYLREEATLLQQAEAELPPARMARAVMETPDGGSTLDAWVAELGGQAKTPEDKARVRAALKARYGLDTLEGDMSTKAMPRLYDVLSRVPERQTGGNDSLKVVVRDRSDFVPSGYYSGEDRKMHLDVGRTGRTGLTKELFGFALPFVEVPPGGWKDSGVKKPKAADVFDHLTLHEVGHAVDDQMNFMGGRMGNSAYGSWQAISAAEVREVAGNGKGFYAAFGPLPKAFLQGYLDHVLAGTDAENDDKLAQLLGDDDAADWSAMAKHAAVAFCKASRMGSGAIGEVTQWDKKAKEAVHDGRVYQEAYADEWYSYAVSVRSRGVGGYQFRAPGEWFAELYANYYGGRLKSSHPDYAWLQALVDTV